MGNEIHQPVGLAHISSGMSQPLISAFSSLRLASTNFISSFLLAICSFTASRLGGESSAALRSSATVSCFLRVSLLRMMGRRLVCSWKRVSSASNMSSSLMMAFCRMVSVLTFASYCGLQTGLPLASSLSMQLLWGQLLLFLLGLSTSLVWLRIVLRRLCWYSCPISPNSTVASSLRFLLLSRLSGETSSPVLNLSSTLLGSRKIASKDSLFFLRLGLCGFRYLMICCSQFFMSMLCSVSILPQRQQNNSDQEGSRAVRQAACDHRLAHLTEDPRLIKQMCGCCCVVGQG